MSFRSKILLVLTGMGVLPILLFGWVSYRFSRSELVQTVNRLQAQSALELARSCERFVDDGLKSLKLAATYIPLDQLSADELGSVLSIPYRQLQDLSIVVALSSTGDALAPPVYAGGLADAAALGPREEIRPEDLDAFSRHVPLSQALEHGSAVGPPYRSRTGARVVLAVRTGQAADRVLAAEFSLRRLEESTRALAGGGGLAFAVDPAGVPIFGEVPSPLLDEERRFIAAGLEANRDMVRSLSRGGAGEWLAAFAPVPRLGWGIVMARPSEQALGAPRRMQLITYFWAGVALVLTGVLGILLSRGFDAPLRALSRAAQALTQGRFEHRVVIDSRDEMAQLAEAFNHMAMEIERRNLEIQRWNEELQGRVEARTQELRSAQEQIMRTRRLTALGSMSAGVVHEINNPMTGLLGLVQLVARQLEPGSTPHTMLDKALTQGKRVTRILESFKQFTEHEQDIAGRRFSAITSAQAAIDLYRDQLEANGVALRTEFDEESPELLGDWVQVGQLLGNLIQNAIDAMPTGGELLLSVTRVGAEAVKLVVQDNGPGIPEDIRERVFDPFYSTKNQAAQIGMGLTLCHKIVDAHHGKISIDSTPGKGTRVEIYMPAAPDTAHLA